MTDLAAALVGTSAVMEAVRARVRHAALSREPVLLVGEAGTGKELAARSVHSLSARSAAPFMRIGCGALTATLFEGEFFGTVKSGGLLSAVPRVTPGQVERAEGGTLLLEDVAELSPACQLKVLRIIQGKQFARIGDTRLLEPNVRVMATTCRSLPELVKAGTFREDLHDCLNAVQIVLPALRDRAGDLEELVRHFLARFGPPHGHRYASVTPGALALLAVREWFDNVKSLEDFIERRVLLAPPGPIVIDEATVESEPSPEAPPVRPTREARMKAEREAVEEAMKEADGDLSQAALTLGVSLRALNYKLEDLGLAAPPGNADGNDEVKTGPRNNKTAPTAGG